VPVNYQDTREVAREAEALYVEYAAEVLKVVSQEFNSKTGEYI